MKVLLVYPPRKLDSYTFPPIGLMYIAQEVERAGHSAEIVDIPYLVKKYPRRFDLADDSIYKYIYSLRGDIIGLSGIASSYSYYEGFTRKIRKFYRNVPIIVGGNVGVPLRSLWENYTDVDYLVWGDGEDVIRLFLQYYSTDMSKIETIPGLYYRRAGRFVNNSPVIKSDIDTIPFLSYDRIDYEYYIGKLKEWIQKNIPDKRVIKNGTIRPLPLLTTRGCPYNCAFCFHFGRSYRAHSVDYVIRNILFLNEKYGVNVLHIIDDLFIADEDRASNLCDKLKGLNLNILVYGGGGKPNLINKKLLEKMREAGFIRFSYGIESGSQRMLDVMNKKTTVNQNYNALKWTEETGIQVIANLVFGMPEEDMQTIDETEKFLISLNFNSKKFSINWATAYPDSALFNWMVEKRLVKDVRKYILEVGSVGQYLVNFSTLSKRSLFRAVQRLIFEVDRAYYLRRKEIGNYYGTYYTYYLSYFLKSIFNYYTYYSRRIVYYLGHPVRFARYLHKHSIAK